MTKKGMIVILSAPSGCGKDTVFREIKKLRSNVCESISATTRAPRCNEADGVNYFFKTNEEFEAMIENNSFLEYASYNCCYYGTPAEPALKAVSDGKICFLIIERKGAQMVMKSYPDAVSIFLMPPSLDVLEQRLKNRNTDSEDDIKNRLEIAREEMKSAEKFQYIVVNNELQQAANEIIEIIDAELTKRN